ncbi:MAG: phosphoribosylglycinamide formyltransferase [Paraperlucidibaca sp.]
MSYRVVVLVSGSGSNLQALLDACGQGAATPTIDATIVGVLSNRDEALALARAARAGVATAVVKHRDFNERADFDAAMIKPIDAWAPDMVVLAGFMRILTADFVSHYSGRLINIHPSLLPKYKGLNTHQRALEAGDAEHGCSVHFVTPELDGGPVIAKQRVSVDQHDSVESLAQRVHQAEHRLYPRVLGWLASSRLRWLDGHLQFDGAPLRQPLDAPRP